MLLYTLLYYFTATECPSKHAFFKTLKCWEGCGSLSSICPKCCPLHQWPCGWVCSHECLMNPYSVSPEGTQGLRDSRSEVVLPRQWAARSGVSFADGRQKERCHYSLQQLSLCTLWLHSYAKTNALFMINYLHICKPHPSMMPWQHTTWRHAIHNTATGQPCGKSL